MCWQQEHIQSAAECSIAFCDTENSTLHTSQYGLLTCPRCRWQMKVEDGLAQREIHARMQAQQAEQVWLAPCTATGPHCDSLRSLAL